jgi:hypothetical protein
MRMSLIELGFTPNFYQFIETLIEIKISVTVTKEVSNTDVQKGNITSTVDKSKTSSVSGSYSYGSWWWRGGGSYNYSNTQNDITTTTTPVDAAFSAKYNYAIEASSLVRTKLVPVPPPPILEQRVRQLMDIERKLFDNQIRRQWEAEGHPFRLAESIFVNDDAIDASGEVLERLALVAEFLECQTDAPPRVFVHPPHSACRGTCMHLRIRAVQNFVCLHVPLAPSVSFAVVGYTRSARHPSQVRTGAVSLLVGN